MRVAGSRSSARASGEAFWPITAQCSEQPTSWNALIPPRALASLMAPSSTRDGRFDRRYLRTTSKLVAELPVAVDIGDRAGIERRKRLLHSHQHSRQPHSRQASRARQFQENNFVHVPLPVLLGPSS